MSFILRQLRGSDNNETIADSVIPRSEVTLGRGADRDILLNDTRIAWQHATIRALGRDEYQLDVAKDASSVLHNGSPVRSTRLNDGDVLILGGRELGFQRFEGRVYLTLKDAPKQKDQSAKQLRAQAQLSLQEVGVSKRRWSWGLFLGVLIVGLLLPLGAWFSGGFYSVLKSTPWPLDELWNSGPLSSAHQGFAQNCKACHLELFEPVPDRACAECHTGLPHHDDDVALLSSSGIEQYRCASCHIEHDGSVGLMQTHPKLCTDCHADPARNMVGSTLSSAGDFLHKHPQLSPQRWVEGEDGQRQDVSVPIGEVLTEKASIIYPHDLHLAESGVEDSQGELHVLECQSCHEYQKGEINFQAVDFAQHCQYCHSLEFDPTEPGRQVPHGSTAAVLSDLRGYFARKVLQGAADVEVAKPQAGRGRDRSVQSARDEQRRTLLAKADGMANDQIDETIRVRLCAKCHTIAEPVSQDTQWEVTPFKQRSLWMTAARFDHSRHKTESCDSCHAARESDTADDVLMPDIANCRTCHGGTHSDPPLLRSLCVDCHGFHLAEHANMDVPKVSSDQKKKGLPAKLDGSAEMRDADSKIEIEQ